ncbi:MAG: hypothetical protein JSV99_01760 [Planctomycetota bacterium]|nr:MAG: hypothetical protein JSV99_01760 [Planctomycetota bacterium]
MVYQKILVIMTTSFTLIFVGCHFPQIVPAKHSYEILENKMIVEDANNITDGPMNVFVYSYERAHDARIYDDEYREIVFFQISPNLETFHFEDETIHEAKCRWVISYFGPDTGNYKVDKGRIDGKRIGPDEYEVDAHISIRTKNRTYKKGFKKTFKAKN